MKLFCICLGFVALPLLARAQVAVSAETIYTMAGPAIQDGVILIRGSKIEAVGKAPAVTIPNEYRILKAKVVTPGLIDAHTVVGLSGILNQPHDQEQLDMAGPIQPELRVIDSYNPRDPLVEWVRNFGVTTVHTGHAPGALISGQTMIVKTYPNKLDEAVVVPAAMIAATLGQGATGAGDKPPGTKSKAVAMLRAELVKAVEYNKKLEKPDPEKRPARDLRLEALTRLLDGKQPLLVTVHRHQDILAVLRIAAEFKLRLVLDGVADAHLVLDEIKQAGLPVILHPTMSRANNETENLSFETASKLKQANIPFALQSGYEPYVPKTRVVLFEGALTLANGLTFDQALASMTIDAARLLGVHDRLGSLEPGKDADIALYDGDPFEYASHCVGVIVSGVVVKTEAH
ncbi:MAG: amidohydrolase family protein [Verrucomicrobia bacterium]|nr:amidohydrolase family protein [Verrucomicrobiota bacterium]